MSSRKFDPEANSGFAGRLMQACNADNPTEIAEVLDISYQAALNYLTNRLPETAQLVNIAKRTGRSLDWLIFGEKKKFSGTPREEDTPLSVRQFEEIGRRVVVEVLNEMGGRRRATQPKTVVVLHSGDVFTEKATGDAALSESRSAKREKPADGSD